MAYLHIKDFKSGLDRRRPQVSGTPGALWELDNAVVSRGGDIERSKKFVQRYALPVGTFGLSAVGGQIYVFTSDLSLDNGAAPTAVPAGVRAQALEAPGAPSMLAVLDVITPGGKPYVIAEYDDGNIYHFYDGVRVSDLDSVADAAAEFPLVIARLIDKLTVDNSVLLAPAGQSITIEAVEPGVPFTLTVLATDGGVNNDQSISVAPLQANVSEVLNVDATGSIQITGGSFNEFNANRIDSVQFDAVELLSASISFGIDNSTTANALANAINSGTTVHGVSAEATGDTVEIRAPVLSGAAGNGTPITVGVAGDVTTTIVPMTGGVDAVAPVAQISRVDLAGTFEALDKWEITLNGVTFSTTGRAAATGRSALVYRKRVYTVAGSLVFYTKLNDYTDYTDVALASGAGFFNVQDETNGADSLTALAKYNDKVAIFARDSITTYTLSTDASANNFIQDLENTGTISARSIVPYGAVDVFYLDESGVRSLRARDSSNSPFVSDVGTVIDTLIAGLRKTLPVSAIRDAVAVAEPEDGRYLLAIGDMVFVLSNFPTSKITAWSMLKPGFVITDFLRNRREVLARSADAIYVYGGPLGDDYIGAGDEPTLVETGFMDGGTQATPKQVFGFDISCLGTWKIEFLIDPNKPDKVVLLGRVKGTTMHEQHIGVEFSAPYFAVRATCESEGPATISSMAIHYSGKGAQ